MKTPRITVIDDEPVVCREIKRFLEKDRYTVETFPKGKPAMERMERTHFDRVQCDLRLPRFRSFSSGIRTGNQSISGKRATGRNRRFEFSKFLLFKPSIDREETR